MPHITGHDRSQTLLLPEAVDDYVGAENPVRFIDAFVDGLDLAAAGFARVAPDVTGRPGYAPADLLKLYIYGYLNRIRSSRRLEAETHRNIEVIWLLRHLKPDFKTIARLPARQLPRLSPGLPAVRAAVPPAGPVRSGADRRGWHADQGGQQ
jgi:transposase